MSNFVLEIMKSVRQLAADAAAAAAASAVAAAAAAAAGAVGAPTAATGDNDVSSAAAPGGTGGVALLPKGAPSEREGASPSLVEGFLEWGVHYLLDNLARALDNVAFAPLVEQLQVPWGGGRGRGGGGVRVFHVYRVVGGEGILGVFSDKLLSSSSSYNIVVSVNPPMFPKVFRGGPAFGLLNGKVPP